MDFCPYFLHLNPSLGILPAQVRTFVVYLLSGALLVAPNLPLCPNKNHAPYCVSSSIKNRMDGREHLQIHRAVAAVAPVAWP
jgi:hypothetical protein